MILDGPRSAKAKQVPKRFTVEAGSVVGQATSSRTSKSFRLENYPDNTRYPDKPDDLHRKCWSEDMDESDAPECLEDSLLFHLLKALFVGEQDNGGTSDTKLLKCVNHSYSEYRPPHTTIYCTLQTYVLLWAQERIKMKMKL